MSLIAFFGSSISMFGLALGLTAGCGGGPETVAQGPVGLALQQAADTAHVPRDLLAAIAVEERGLRLAPRRVYASDDHVPVAGHLELRHGAFDSLQRASVLVGVSEVALIEDTALATIAGARVLAELGGDAGDDLSRWVPALRTLSGLSDGAAQQAYADRVLAVLQRGGRFAAYAGETVVVPAHPEVQLVGVTQQALGSVSDFPGATWTETSCTNKCNVGRNPDLPVDTIVIHDTEGGWNASVATLQNDSGKSVHYLIDSDGSRVTQFRPETDITWHAGNFNYNSRSVGIEHVGYIDDPNGFSDGLYETSVRLVENIRTRHSVPLDRQHIIGHYQVPDGTQQPMASPACAAPLLSCLNDPKYGGASNHTDPGPQWQWCQYMQRLGGTCTCNDTNPHFTCTTDKTQAVRCLNGQVEVRTCQTPCVGQGNGVDDLCTAPVVQPPRVPISILQQRVVRQPDGTLTTGPTVIDRPGDSPGTSPITQGSGCSVGGPATRTPFAFFVVLLAWVAARRRRVA